jgi:hypothetical protein
MSVLQYCTVLYDVQCASRTVNDVLCVWLFILFVVLIVVCLQSCLHQTVNAFCAPNSFRGKRSISILSRPPPPLQMCVCLRVVEWSCILLCTSLISISFDLLYCTAAFVINIVAIFTEKKKTISTAVLLFASSSFSLRRGHPSSQAAIRCYCVFSVVIIDLFHNKRKSCYNIISRFLFFLLNSISSRRHC